MNTSVYRKYLINILALFIEETDNYVTTFYIFFYFQILYNLPTFIFYVWGPQHPLPSQSRKIRQFGSCNLSTLASLPLT